MEFRAHGMLFETLMNARPLFLLTFHATGCVTYRKGSVEGSARIAPDGSADLLVAADSGLVWRHVDAGLSGSGSARSGAIASIPPGAIAPTILAAPDDGSVL